MSVQEKLKGFLSDTLIYGIGSIFSRSFAFLLIPLYTSYLDKSQYANLILLQLIFTVLSFFLALNSGVFFYYYEYKKDKLKKMVFANWVVYEIVTSFFILILSSAFFSLISPIFAISDKDAEVGKTFFFPFLLIILQLFPYLVFNTYYNLLRIKLEAKKSVIITIIDALLVITFVVYFLVIADMGITGVVLGQLVAKSILALGILLSGFYTYLNPNLVSWTLIKKIVAYSSPFFLSSTLLWVMNSIDKILGTQLLTSQAEVAYLGLAMQVTMPTIMLAGVISQSYGPYVMSIKHEANANNVYQEIFSLIVYGSAVASILLLTISPFLVDILANETFYPTLKVIPLFILATIINIIMLQLCLGLNLAKKTGYIAIATIFGGVIGFVFNLYFQPILGIKAAGYSQILAYGLTSVIVYKYSQKFMYIEYDLKWTAHILLVMTGSIFLLNLLEDIYPTTPHFKYLVIGGITSLILGVYGESRYKLLNLAAQLVNSKLAKK